MATATQLRNAHTSAPCDLGGGRERRGTIFLAAGLTQSRQDSPIWNYLYVTVFAAMLMSTGCATPRRLKAVPAEFQDKAVLPGFARPIRSWGDRLSPEFVAECVAAAKREEDSLAKRQVKSELQATNFLAVSGGGANGAFAAGLLCGWSAAGTRPQFSAVTGISTGALIAPFAFLGPKYDGILRDTYTAVETKDILSRRPILEAIFSDAIADSKPLERLVGRFVDKNLLESVAEEYRKGRTLLILTVDLDAQRPVVWNMTAIAASGHAEALRLFRRVMLASASIPGAFPPVMIDVDVDEDRYQEMHVDGGVMEQVFFYPPSFVLDSELRAAGLHQRDRRLYVIRNAYLESTASSTERRTLKIAARAIQTLIQTQGLADVHRLYTTARRDGVDFNLAYIPRDFGGLPKSEFDPLYMNRLFDRGFELARDGKAWSKVPPDL